MKHVRRQRQGQVRRTWGPVPRRSAGHRDGFGSRRYGEGCAQLEPPVWRHGYEGRQGYVQRLMLGLLVVHSYHTSLKTAWEPAFASPKLCAEQSPMICTLGTLLEAEPSSLFIYLAPIECFGSQRHTSSACPLSNTCFLNRDNSPCFLAYLLSKWLCTDLAWASLMLVYTCAFP